MVFLRAISALLCFSSFAIAQQPAQTGAGVSGIQGVEQKVIESIRKVEPPTTVPVAPQVAPQGVNKVDGVETIDGVKATGREAITPPPPPPPPPTPPPAAAGGANVGTASSIQAVKGVAGLNALKRQNLEAALVLKDAPTITGAGKAKAAAAALLGGPSGKPSPQPQPKEDGRDGFQEFDKLNANGS